MLKNSEAAETEMKKSEIATQKVKNKKEFEGLKVKKARKSKTKVLPFLKTELRLKMKRERPTRKFNLKLHKYNKKLEIYKSRPTHFPLHKHKCKDCGRSFAKRWILNYHKRQVLLRPGRESSCDLGLGLLLCEECGYVTTKLCAQRDLRRHFLKVHSPGSAISLMTEEISLAGNLSSNTYFYGY